MNERMALRFLNLIACDNGKTRSVETRGHRVDGKVGHFQVRLKVEFRLES